MTEARGGSQPDPAIALANFLRSAIRAIAAQDPQRQIWSMINDLAEFQEQLVEQGPVTPQHPIFDRAIESLVTHGQQTELVEAQIHFAVNGMRLLAELSSTDATRNYRLSRVRTNLRSALIELDEIRNMVRKPPRPSARK